MEYLEIRCFVCHLNFVWSSLIFYGLQWNCTCFSFSHFFLISLTSKLIWSLGCLILILCWAWKLFFYVDSVFHLFYKKKRLRIDCFIYTLTNLLWKKVFFEELIWTDENTFKIPPLSPYFRTCTIKKNSSIRIASFISVLLTSFLSLSKTYHFCMWFHNFILLEKNNV